MIWNYLKITVRSILKYKAYSFINIFGLATGIALCLLILMYVKHELSYDRFHENAENIVRVHMFDEEGLYALTPSMVAPSVAAIAPEVTDWVRLYEPTKYNPVIINANNNQFQENSFLYADSSFFRIFTFKFLSGDPNSALVNPRSLVLTNSIATKLFGSSDPLGRSVEARIFNTVTDFEVTGVIEDMPTNSHYKFDYIGSLNTRESWSQLTDSEIRSANFYSYLQITSPDELPQLQTKIDSFVEETVKEQRDIGLALQPLTEIYHYANADFEISPMGNIRNIYGFTFLAIVVLLIAIINYINMATARSATRASEVGIRKSLGAAKSQLIKQFYGESLILTIAAVLTALILVEFTKPYFFGILGKELDLSLISGMQTVFLLAGIVIVTSAFAGSYPAFLLSSFQPVKVLKGSTEIGRNNGSLRKGLVVMQFAISTFLILSTTIIYQQTDFILSSDLGFDKEQIVVLPARDNELASKQDLLKSEILRQPGVISATYMSNIPGKVFGGYAAEHTPGSEQISTSAGAADLDLITTLGIELLAGPGFPQSPGYTKEQGYRYLINENLANSFGWSPEEAVGQPFNVLGNREGEVVGVMKNFNFASLHEAVDPLALFIDHTMYNYLMVKIAPTDFRQTLSSLEGTWQQIAPHRPFEFEFLDQQLNTLYESEVNARNLLTLFSGLAIMIACLGLVGLSSFLVERKAKEIGIRKVLGASILSILTLLSTDFIKLVLFGFAIGAPIAWFIMEKWLSNFAFRINIGVSVFLITITLGTLITLITISWQSLKAALANPVESLKSE